MKLVKKLILTFICCFPIGVAISDYELIPEEFRGLEETGVEAEKNQQILEPKELQDSEAKELEEEKSKFAKEEINSPISQEYLEKEFEDVSKKDEKAYASPDPLEILKSEKKRKLSQRELEIREIIGVGDGPITQENIRAGLIKLKNKGRLTPHEQRMFVFLMKLLSEFMVFKKMVTQI